MNTTGNFHELLDGSELSSLIELDQNFFPNPWTPRQWQELNFAQHLLFSWKKNLGFALFGYLKGDDTAHLYKILIHPDQQGRGEVQDFWSCIKAELQNRGARSIYLEVEAQNERAIGFYQKVGFQTLRKVKAYYSDGSDALMMNLTL